MTCSSCHAVHGDNPKQLVKSSTNDTCYTCHMEKRGPFVHNHQPVSEDCSICHQPHGTNVDSLLRARAPILCQECHSHESHPGPGDGPAERAEQQHLAGRHGRAGVHELPHQHPRRQQHGQQRDRRALPPLSERGES